MFDFIANTIFEVFITGEMPVGTFILGLVIMLLLIIKLVISVKNRNRF